MKSASGLTWVVPILGDALRLVYQNLLLEGDEKIVECSKRVWKLLLQVGLILCILIVLSVFMRFN